jgi:isoleucyl-tRNA synthetase
MEDIEIASEDIPGWQIATDGDVTVALDLTLTDDLRAEGIARELVNRIQNIRKASDFEVTDRIIIRVKRDAALADAIAHYGDYICQETLADQLETTDAAPTGAETFELVDDIVAELAVVRV